MQVGRAMGLKGRGLEEKACSILIKNWMPVMKVDGTIKHVYVHLTLYMLSFVVSEEFFDLMVRIMRETSEEGQYFVMSRCAKIPKNMFEHFIY